MDYNRSSLELQGSTLAGNPQLLNRSWLESTLNETLLPGKPWHKVLHKLGRVLADELKQQLQDEKKRQMIFQLLGPMFVQTYFSEYPHQPGLLSPEHMTVTDRYRLEQATTNMLQERCSKAAENLCLQLRSEFTGLSPEMMSFAHDTSGLIEANMDLLLSIREEEQKGEQSSRDQDSSAWFSDWTLPARRRPQSIESKDVHLVIRRQTMIPKDAHFRPEPKAPPLSCPGSDVLGESICGIVSSHREHLSMVCERLSGRLLPNTIRHLIWIDKLLNSDPKIEIHGTHSTKNIEKVSREKFGRMVQHRLSELKLRHATRSPISGLIENAVVEKYEDTPCMQPFASSEEMILETSKTLNVLYVHNGRYEPYLIHWLFPLQVTLKRTPSAAEHPYELAMYLHFLMQNLFPSWLEIFTMAERVMNLLEAEDTELFNHLQSGCRKNVKFDPKDFLVELIVREREEAQKLYEPSDGSQQSHLLSKEYLASPVIFLRKWMGEGFVSILDFPAILLIWDQLYMQDWNRKVMENFCLAVLMLLKYSLMEAEDCPALRQVFLFHGYHLLTADIQRAWIHLQQGGLPADIPDFNRLRSPRVVPPSRRAIGFTEIRPVGVKDVLLTLSLPAPLVLPDETWLKTFDPLAVKLTVSVYYDHVKLRSQASSAKAVLLQTTRGKKDGVESKEFILRFTDLWTFDSLDPTEFSDFTGADAFPFIILRIVYNRTENDSPTLGWVKVDAFQPDPAGIQGVWAPREYSPLLPVCPGKEPVNMIAPTIMYNVKESAHGQSKMQLTVYDPLKEIAIVPEDIKRDLGEPHFIYAPWVPHSEATILPDPTPQDHPFDLYIDALHYVPDCATIIKVTGKILNSGLSNIADLVTFPTLTSHARNPKFQYRTVLGTNKRKAMTAGTFLVLQISTVDAASGIQTVLGNCRLGFFDASRRLNVGGFQVRIVAGMPPKGPSSITPSSLNEYPPVPCCSILLRLLPHTEDPVPAPNYQTGFYYSEEAKPTRSELQIISSFQRDESFPKLAGDMAKNLMDREQIQVAEDQVESWYEERLDLRRHPVPQHLLSYINFHQVVRYHQESGVRVRVAQAFGLQVEGLYLNAFARILKGQHSRDLPELPSHWGGEEKFLTQHHDFSSMQTSPRWTDSSTVLHPYLDEQSVLLVQLFGMDAVYMPDSSGQRPGAVVPRAGQNLQLYSQSQLGWTAVPLFDGRYVKSGIHSAPLFQGSPTPDFLQAVISRPLIEVITEGVKKKTLTFFNTFGSIDVEIWDGHYFDDERNILPEIQDLLTFGKVAKFLKTRSKRKGAELSQLVLQSMDKKFQKLKRNSPQYQQQERLYEEAMGNTFYSLIETALLNAGYSPL